MNECTNEPWNSHLTSPLVAHMIILWWAEAMRFEPTLRWSIRRPSHLCFVWLECEWLQLKYVWSHRRLRIGRIAKPECACRMRL